MAKLNFSQLRGIRLRDYAIRFLFGGTISVIAALIGQWATGRIGGIFTAFPAILLASLTLINQEDGKQASAMDAQGAVLGAVALVLASILLSVTLGALAGAWSLLLGLGAWLVCSVGLYFLSVKLGWLRIEKRN
jgi:hypothetical protein